jgi:hypothetical protein
MGYAVRHRPAIRHQTPLQRTRNANEFDFEMICRRSNEGISVRTHVNKRELRRQLRISFAQSLLHVIGSLQCEAGAHSMHH